MTFRPFGHLGLKLLSLAIALLLWLTVAGEQTVERGLRVPLEIQNMPEKLQLVEDPPQLVDVRVRGAASTLGRLVPGDLVAIIDVRGARPGRRLFHLTDDEVRGPFGVEVEHVSPPTVALSFEIAGTAEIPVTPAITGEPAPGYVVGKVAVEPQTVIVAGPQTALGRLTSAITEPVSVAGATAAREEVVTLGVMEPSVRLQVPGSAHVTVQILPAPVDRVLHTVPVRLKGLTANLSGQVVPATVDVRVRGAKQRLDVLHADSVNAYIDVSGLGPGRYDLSVRAEPTEGFEVVGINPETVRIAVR
jgi:YbbR domain-containing protein